MGWNNERKLGHPEYMNLYTDWMIGHIADGIRTVCGMDGGAFGAYGGGYSSGLPFFGHYHKGESIS
jgi:hypothetical protein